MDILFQPLVLAALLIALAAGFLLGRAGRRRVDPSDFSHNAQPHAGRVSPATIPLPVTTPFVEADMPPVVLEHLQNKQVIHAIKALREAHPELGLAQAKDAVEAYARRNGL